MSSTESSTNTSGNAAIGKKKPGIFQKGKIWLIVLGLFIVSNAGIYFFQKHQQGKLRDQHEAIVAQKYLRGKEYIEMQNHRLGELLNSTLVWGVRGELMRGNIELINQHLITLVQDFDMDLVVIADSSGKVILSTNKKYEGKPLVAVMPEIPPMIKDPQVIESTTDKIVTISPIMGDARRLGTIVVHYKSGEATQKYLEALKADPMKQAE